MTPAERELITDLFTRLRSADKGMRDREAEALIADAVAQAPAAPYLLTQTVLVQEQALKAALERIAELEAGQTTRDAPAPGFLASAPRLGPWGARRSEPAERPAFATPSVPSPMAAAPGGGGGFLRSAMMTAAGVAGGALLFEGVRNLLGHGSGPFANAAAHPTAASAPPSATAGTADSASHHADDQRDDQAAFDDQDNDMDFADIGSDDDNLV